MCWRWLRGNLRVLLVLEVEGEGCFLGGEMRSSGGNDDLTYGGQGFVW
jgi:hypothetical protein